MCASPQKEKGFGPQRKREVRRKEREEGRKKESERGGTKVIREGKRKRGRIRRALFSCIITAERVPSDRGPTFYFHANLKVPSLYSNGIGEIE